MARPRPRPSAQAFWAAWDRQAERRWSRTRVGPAAAGEVRMRGPRVQVSSRELQATLHLGEGHPVESICPSGGGWGWTRKRAGIPVTGEVRAGGRVWQLDGAAVDDESAGY